MLARLMIVPARRAALTAMFSVGCMGVVGGAGRVAQEVRNSIAPADARQRSGVAGAQSTASSADPRT
jgi:hypothetical protein